MKHLILSLWLALVSAGLLNVAPAMTDNPHVLTQLWTQYENARKADRPQKQAEILKQIKEEATRQHLPVDFYDAATTYVQVVAQRNWKEREPANQALEAEVKAFDEPIVTFRWMASYKGVPISELWDYVKAHPNGFQARTEAFYTDISQYLGGALPRFVRNDYEYVLWRMLRSYRSENDSSGAIYQALSQEVEGRYPNQAALEYYLVAGKSYPASERAQYKKDLQAVADKYAGKAAALYPLADLLNEKARELEEAKAAGEAFRALYEEAQAFEKQRKAFKGEEALVAKGCERVKKLIETLTDKSLQVTFEGTRAQVLLQNLTSASLTLYKGEPSQSKSKKTVKTWQLRNDKASFYVKDTVEVELPQLADDTYYLEAVQGKLTDQALYNQYTLSIATREDARGWCAYVTDYQTGKPLDRVKLVLMKNGKEVASACVAQKGFTPLPKALQKYLKDEKYYSLKAVSGDRSSQNVTLREYHYKGQSNNLQCHVYKDKGAYNPGDTLHYKVIVFEGDPMRKLAVKKGLSLHINLLDAEDNELSSQEVVTNAFGAASGEFLLPTGLRNGYFTLEVESDDDDLAYEQFRVDEFVLPSFDLVFDKSDKLYLEGDEVPVSGRLVSYSGHPLSGARIALKVSHYSEVVSEEELEVGADNTFRASFVARSGSHEIKALVTDATGETREFSTSLYVTNEIELGIAVENAAAGTLVLSDEEDEPYRWGRRAVQKVIVDQDELAVCLTVRDGQYRTVSLPLTYTLSGADPEPVHNGSVLSGDKLKLSLEGLPSGIYTLTTTASVKRGEKVLEAKEECRILLLRPSEKALTPAAKRMFAGGPDTIAEGASVTARLGTADGDAFVVATLFGNDKEVLETRLLTIPDGSVETLSFDYKAAYPDAVRLQLFYFLKGKSVTYDRQYRRAITRVTLPLQCTRFQDKAFPSTEYSFVFQTSPEAEALVAAWDKSLDAIARNYWPVVTMQNYSVPEVSVRPVCGKVGGDELVFNDVVMAYGTRSLRTKNAAVMTAAAPMMYDLAVEESADKEMAVMEETTNYLDGAVEGVEDVPARSDFASALTFQPHLRPSADGTLEVKFSTSDKLSTYYVTVYAHDAAMRNALLTQEMVVSLPVKVSLVEPGFLYEGDTYEVALSVSSVAEEPVSGKLRLVAGTTLLGEVPVTLEPGGTASHRFPVQASAAGSLTLTGSFVAADFSDAVRVEIPVYPSRQTLTEAHSAVLRAGQDRDALLADLRSRFVNIPGAEALLKEITVLDMVRDAIPSHVEPSGKDVLSLSEAWYVRLMASRLSSEEGASSGAFARTGSRSDAEEEVTSSDALLEKMLACRNADGGFGWFEGMDSSPVITAVVLERLAKLRSRGFEVPEVASSVKYLDRQQFETSLPVWRGSLSDAQYMHVRALYSEVPFEWKAVSQTDKKRLSSFTKEAQAYLVPTKQAGRGLQGQILAKARRLLTLKHLQSREGGLELAKAWGISFAAKARLEQSIKADVTSLLEYAVEHRDGGWYYPNAVMPWRGLLESEAYAHALLCDLLASEEASSGAFSRTGSRSDAEEDASSEAAKIADGIRLWLMLQKETQKWDADPAFVDAITAILDGSEAVLRTRVLALSGTYEAPFQQIKAAGNGFTLDRKFYRASASGDLQEIQPGGQVAVGEKIVVKYEIWNGENRSFVKVDAGREASLRPAQQLSGHVGYGFIVPWRRGYVFGFTPQGYRNVKTERTEYFFDSYPEEKTTLTEEFFVTQAGSFVAPVVTIESLYAPHYRANSSYRAPLVSQ